MDKTRNKFFKVFLLSTGTVALALAALGVILPILPTAPFVMLAAACYMRSSDTLYNKLKEKKLYMKTVGNMVEKKGMTMKTKLMILLPVLGMLLAAFLAVDNTLMRGAIILLGTVKTVVFIRIRTISKYTQ